jgi:wyosine [tRNA(Phe)-imidazoG37] synthetase (radical SAM superfamily)
MQINEKDKKKFINDFLEKAKQKLSSDIIQMKPALERTAEAMWEVKNITISPIDEPAVKQNLRDILEE